jgi:hypothetical protein
MGIPGEKGNIGERGEDGNTGSPGNIQEFLRIAKRKKIKRSL